MSGHPLIDLFISLLAVALLGGLTRWLGWHRPLHLDLASARQRLADDEPDFLPQRWLLDDQGRMALAVSDAEFGLVIAKGAMCFSRRGPLAALKHSWQGDHLNLCLDDHTIGEVALSVAAPTARSWWQSQLATTQGVR